MDVQTSPEAAVGTCCDDVTTGTVEQVAVANLPTEWGDFRIAAYRLLTTDEEFVVLSAADSQSTDVGQDSLAVSHRRRLCFRQ